MVNSLWALINIGFLFFMIGIICALCPLISRIKEFVFLQFLKKSYYNSAIGGKNMPPTVKMELLQLPKMTMKASTFH
jgi:hypothetical protein